MANKIHSPSFYKKIAVAFCCKKMSAFAFDRNATAIMEKAVAYPQRSDGKSPIWELTRCASKVVSGQNVHSPDARSSANLALHFNDAVKVPKLGTFKKQRKSIMMLRKNQSANLEPFTRVGMDGLRATDRDREQDCPIP